MVFSCIGYAHGHLFPLLQLWFEGIGVEDVNALFKDRSPMNNLDLRTFISLNMDISMCGKSTLLVDKSKLSVRRGDCVVLVGSASLPGILGLTESDHEVVWGMRA